MGTLPTQLLKTEGRRKLTDADWSIFWMQGSKPSIFVLTAKSGAPRRALARSMQTSFVPIKGLPIPPLVSSLNIFTDLQQRGFANDPKYTYPDNPLTLRAPSLPNRSIHTAWQFAAS
jgi:hypothetical protein